MWAEPRFRVSVPARISRVILVGILLTRQWEVLPNVNRHLKGFILWRPHRPLREIWELRSLVLRGTIARRCRAREPTRPPALQAQLLPKARAFANRENILAAAQAVWPARTNLIMPPTLSMRGEARALLSSQPTAVLWLTLNPAMRDGQYLVIINPARPVTFAGNRRQFLREPLVAMVLSTPENKPAQEKNIV